MDIHRQWFRPRRVFLPVLFILLLVLLVRNHLPRFSEDIDDEEEAIFQQLTKDREIQPFHPTVTAATEKHGSHLKRNHERVKTSDPRVVSTDTPDDSHTGGGSYPESEEEDDGGEPQRHLNARRLSQQSASKILDVLKAKTDDDPNSLHDSMPAQLPNKDSDKIVKPRLINRGRAKYRHRNITKNLFQVIRKSESWVYSAFYEKLPNGTSYVRAFGITKHDLIGHIFCHVTGRDKHTTVISGQLTLLPDGHADRTSHTASVLLCELPVNLSPQIVSFTFKKDDPIQNQVRINYPGKRIIRDFTVCNSILFNDFDKPSQLVQNWEMAITLGTKFFYVYTLWVSERVERVLKEYEAMGLAKVYPWEDYPPNLAWYHAQMVAVNDCVYRNRNVSTYVVVQDTDEVIIPIAHFGWGALINSYVRKKSSKGEQYASFTIESSDFCEKPTDRQMAYATFLNMVTHEVQSFMLAHNVTMFQILVRSKHWEFPIRPKSFVRPELITTMGIHFVHTHHPGYTSVLIPKETAIVQHYRKCSGDERVFEHHIFKYFAGFYERLNSAYTRLASVFQFQFDPDN